MTERISDGRLVFLAEVAKERGERIAHLGGPDLAAIVAELQERRAADAEQARSAEEAWAEWLQTLGPGVPKPYPIFLAGYAAGARERGGEGR